MNPEEESGGGAGRGSTRKIRTRRCHRPASSEPYSLNKGIIKTVKESVKNIVPTWLQQYFTQREETSPNEPWSSDDEDVNYHPTFAAEITDNTREVYGRITPEPTRINLEGPSTSTAGLNYGDTLTRPSLHRAHLNCTSLDSDSPQQLCQPSTSAFTSSHSQHDDDISTSGFSSRESDKDVAVPKSASVSRLWCAEEAERPISQHTTATSVKKPAFNLSAFGAPSPSLGYSSAFKTSQLGDSPFYHGKTTYGGAAGAGKKYKARITPYQFQAPVKHQMQAKPVNAKAPGVASATAQRLLKTLDQMSTPVSDAKKVRCYVPPPVYFPPERSTQSLPDFYSPRKRAESNSPPVQRLLIPTPASQYMYYKRSRTPSAESSGKRQRIDVSHEGMKERSPREQQRDQSERTVSNPEFSTSASNGLPPAAQSGGGGGKMRRERGVHRQSKPVRAKEEMKVPALPDVPLPISTSSLPNFSFGLPASTTAPSLSVSPAQSVPEKVQPASNASSPAFRFSSPIVKSTEAEVLPPMSIGSFKFSDPVTKSSEPEGPKDTPVMPLINSAVNNITSKIETEKYDSPFKPAEVLKEGSVLDLLKSPGFASPTSYSLATPPVTTSTVVYTRPAISSFSAAASGVGEASKQKSSFWRCAACQVENKMTDNKCIACQMGKASKPNGTKCSATSNSAIKSATSTTGTQDFGEKVKPGATTWECDTCMVLNKLEARRCICCDTQRIGIGETPSRDFPAATENTTAVSSSSGVSDTTVTLGFGDKFKKPKDAWECSVCLVTNKAEDSKCVACQSDKPGGSVPVVSSSASSLPSLSDGFLGLDKFKKPEGSWDCDTCLVQNKPDAIKCVACQSAKPGSKAEGFSTATSSAASSAPSAPSFKFGIQSSSSELTQTLGSTGKDFKLGEQTGFKFGITSDPKGSVNTITGDFGISKTEGSMQGSFPVERKSEDSSKESKSSSSFNFGLPSDAPTTSGTGFQLGTANLGQQANKEGLNKPALGSFSFGIASAASSEDKTGISGFKCGNTEEKKGAATPFSLKSPEGKKDEIPSAKGGFAVGTVESGPAPHLILGRRDDKQVAAAPSDSLVSGKKAENEEAKVQPTFACKKVEQTKDDSTGKPAFSFSLPKPAEKKAKPPAKAIFAFGAQANPADPAAAKPAFSFSNPSSAAPSVAAGGSGRFSSATSASNLPPSAFMFGQASSTVSSSAFGNLTDSSTSQYLGFSQGSKPPMTTSTTNAPVPFLFGTAAATNSTANSGFGFAAPSTSTAASAGSSSSLVFGPGSSTPATGPGFGASQTPTFVQSQGSSQPSTSSFSSLPPPRTSSTSLFPAGSQSGPPAFASVSSTSQPSIFGQATQQPGFGSGTSASSGPVFQFGSNPANFNFTSNNPGVFTFGAAPGAAPGAPAQQSGFSFSHPSAFSLGSNGKNIFSSTGSSSSGSSLSTRKIKTAVRRRK